MAFLTVITRTVPGREHLLHDNQASLRAQSDPDYQHLIITDEERRGVAWANGQMAVRDWSALEGQYVLILDDDDVVNPPDLIANLKAKAAQSEPDLFMVKMDHGELGVLPTAHTWGQAPVRSGQGCSSVIPTRALFLQAVKAYQPAYDGDYDFVKACYDQAEQITWLDVIATRVQQLGKHNEFKPAKNALKILLVWPGHVISTVDCAAGYSRALRALGHTVQDFSYHNRLAFYQQALKHFEQVNPAFAAQRKEGDFLVLASESIAIEAVDFNPDVCLIVNGMALHARAYELLWKLRIPTLTMLTESPYADVVQGLALKNSRVSAALTNDQNSVQPLMEFAGIPVDYLPHSFDPAQHYPRAVAEQYHSDLFFFGTLWPERQALFKDLKAMQNGYTFRVGGVDPAIEYGETRPEHLANTELARYYCGAKIALNHNRTLMGVDLDDAQHPHHIQAGQAYSLGPRAYEIAACGAFGLHDDSRPELREVFGDSVATYVTAHDLAAQVQYYLRHEQERVDMANEARQRVQTCTFENRARAIVLPALENLLHRSN